MLRASIRAKEAPLKVAQIRLNDRGAQPGIESCHDSTQDQYLLCIIPLFELLFILTNNFSLLSLAGEVYQLSQSIDSLTEQLHEAVSN